jgi:hypothetical protein
MRPHSLRLLAAGFAALLVLVALALPLTHRADARAADFAPSLSAEAARARVAQAQEASAAHIAAASPAASADASNLPFVPVVYFSETGHHLSNRAGFLDYWRANGGLLLFGYPLTEEISENGRVVQYFERARFEYHPEAGGTPQLVQLGLVGREVLAYSGRTINPAPPADGARYFPETQHNLYGTFRRYWEKRGGLDRFGFPISEEFDELAADGQMRRVQYFERARFEYHPEDLDGFYRGRGLNIASLHEVELGDLGRQIMLARGIQSPSFQALEAAPQWSPRNWPRRIEVNLSAQQLYAYEGDLLVYQAPVATGRDGFNTPTGDYAIYDKYTMQTMVGNAAGESWYVPDIPWVQYVVGGVALHGTYWHDQWGTGTRMSHGCINLNIDDAQWLFQWADIGVPVSIHY